MFLLLLLSSIAPAQVPVLTQRYDMARDGLNAAETTLTLSNVNTSTFGKLFSFPVDGRVFAQPLYVPTVSIAGGTHNVLYVATQHGSLSAYDADGLQLQPLWTVDLATNNCPNGFTCTPVPYGANTGSVNNDIVPVISITGTPVIDPTTWTIYVVVKTQEISGSTTNYVYRLHALDITTGQERPNSPVVIQGQVPGTGSPQNNGFVVFSPLYTEQRPGLALANGAIYIGIGSWGDTSLWHGWVFAYSTSSLAQLAVFSDTPNGAEAEGGIWMAGNGLAADTSGNLYFSTGNGAFDGTANYSDSFLKLTTPGLTVADYFTPYNQSKLDAADLDIASGGVLLLPDSAGTTQHPHILMGCGKNGAIYVVDRDHMGTFNSMNDSQIIQEVTNVIGDVPLGTTDDSEDCYGMPAYWQGNVYWVGVGDALKMFTFTNGLMSTSAVSKSSETYQFPGTSPVISANGATQGIAWAIENNGAITQDLSGSTAILHAYDATNVASELYNSGQVASDAAGAPIKFSQPMVANGKVYFGTQSSVAVYGLLSSMPQAAPPVLSPSGGTFGTAQAVTISSSTPGTTIYYTTDGSTPNAGSNAYVGPVVLTASMKLTAIAVGAGFRSSSMTVGTYVISGTTPAPAFVQGNYSVPTGTKSPVQAAYQKAQAAGDLNVVVVGWEDISATATIAPGGVTDSAGNAYTQAGPTLSDGSSTQAIYYAKGIVAAGAGANTVTINFTNPATNVDLRILEYSGLDTNNPFDVSAGATGESTNSTVTLTTTNANDVIVGANLVQTTSAAGAGFNSRIVTSPNGDIAEDESAKTAGSYTVNGSVNGEGWWLMQAVAFKVAGGNNPPPTVTSISPASGSTTGGTAVSITGTNFVTGATVTFGGTAATNVVVVSGTQITATTPAGSTGAVTVTVTVSGQSGGLTSGYTYVVVPTVSSVSPNNGPAAGGMAVTITGTNFATGAAVTFGATAAANVMVVSGTQITATTPAGSAGAVTVTVTVNGQSGSLTNGFSYIVPPVVSSVTPNSGSTLGGTAVTIAGTNFAAGAAVTFGAAAATNVVVVSATKITATTPAGSAGGVTVMVTNLGSQSGSLTNGYTYVVVPTVSSVAPNNGPPAGGTAVTITGTNFASGATVTFGGTAASNVVVVSSTSITATTPAGSAGAVAVTVTLNGQSGSLTNGFTYNGAVPISFAQVASATPQSSTATVAVSYPGAQTAGDLNIVVVGWNDTKATVQSVKDSAGNNYNPAIGPTSGTGLRQSIYYAATILGGSNTVTVTFSQAAAAPDIRILEYRGVTTLDATAGASGNSGTSSSGAATTTSANELIFGANMVATLTGAAGSGFTSRVITSPDGDIAEDKVVTTAGSNTATATLTDGAGPWVMQMVTFSAVSGPIPTVSSVSPSSGSTAGGTAVTITGTNFVAGATVKFGSTAATNVVAVSSTSITATTPAASAGAVAMTVTNPGGQSGSLASAFTYIAPPTVSSVSPNSGALAGGTAVTITGTNFAVGAAVTFGGTAASNVVVASSTSITATTPAGSAGAVTVTVSNSNGLIGSSAGAFTYVGAPTVSSVSPSSGSTTGGTAVTITGTNFVTGATVTFGGTAATNVAVVSGTQITATTPAGNAGAVMVTVTVSLQSGSLTSGYTYVVVPSVSSVAPNNGPPAGGTAVTITGTNFVTGATVTFGGTAAANVVVVSGTQITATTPAGSAGAVTVTVTVNGQNGSLTNGFTYIVPPVVSSVTPNSGSTLGGTAVTIAGTNFAAGAAVTFGAAAATNVVVVSGTKITATTPAGSAGAVTVTVTNLGSQSGSLTNGYTYVVVPTVSSVAPNNGPVAGGTAVTITGTNFAAGATVKFGSTAATNLVVVSSTSITATTPAGSAGAVTVNVTVNGQSGSLANGFTYNGTVAISFAQVASATPQSATATVAVSYPGAQTAGDLNIVVVGWNDTKAAVQSVKDSAGNSYTPAIGPTSGTGLRQSIYYASNIAGGSNTVTVTFSQAAAFPDIRILEYRGVTTLDVTAGASGNSSTSSSGAATTTSANELIFGANMVATLTGAAGSGFTSRVITSPDGDIAEDKVVTTAGSNTATATLTDGAGPWVMQMATFK